MSKEAPPVELFTQLLIRLNIFIFLNLTNLSIYYKTNPIIRLCTIAGVTGFEPATPAFGEPCSNQLSYTPMLQYNITDLLLLHLLVLHLLLASSTIFT